MAEARAVCVRSLDAHELAAVERHFPAADPRRHRDRLAEQTAGHVLYLVAWRADQPVGHVLVRFTGSSEARVTAQVGPCPHVEDLFVLPRCRSQGLGTQLMAAAEDAVRTRGHSCLGLSVASHNEEARRFYSHLGYSDCGLGEYPTSGSYLDATGQARTWSDTSYYLVKELAHAMGSEPETRDPKPETRP